LINHIQIFHLNNDIIIQGIDIAEETSNYSRIIRGLKSGDRVLAKYDQQLDDGQKVKIK
jgi:hypothetical protein